MLFNSPLSSDKADRLVRLLGVSADTRVLDAGCGTGELLIRVLEAGAASGLGVDINTESLAAARSAADGRLGQGACEFRELNLQAELPGEGEFDVAICMGATHAFASGEAAFPRALETLSGLLRTGGQLLVGEGYWKQPPASDYLRFLGDPAGIYRDHAGNVALAEQSGLVPLYAAVSSDDEWDDFEWSHRRAVEQLSIARPGDPAVAEKLVRSREWRDAYLRWGRVTMGFGFYLFLKPPAVE
jgi:SAM-dependent methyltransferase